MQAPRVAIFVDMLAAYGREVLMGISRYIRTHQPWMIYGDPERVVAPISELGRWRGDGVIAQIYATDLHRMVAATRVPVVNVSEYLPQSVYPSVLPDNHAVGRLAGEYLLSRGFRFFGYCGFRGHRYAQVRGEAFRERVREAGYDCSWYESDPPQDQPQTWHQKQVELGAWIRSLTRPAGVLCCNDTRARHVAEVCYGLGVRIPEDLALLGVDDDELVCEMSNPPLSSVDVSAEQVGYEAAALLDRLMHGASPPPTPTLVPPVGVVTRRSTDVLAIADEMVARAMRFIRDHVGEPLAVADVAATVPISRRVLERRFRAALGTTIGDAIVHRRMDRAKQLLTYSDAPMATIAEQCGFHYIQQFNACFKRHTGITPVAWRRQFRTR